MFTRTAGLALAAVMAVAIAGCGGSGSSSSSSSPASTTTTARAATATVSPAATSAKVDIKNFLYAPAKITVAKGAKVTWTNEDSSPHTATVTGGFDTDSISQGKSASITMTKPGSYAYFCSFHPYMHGTIVVQG